MPELPFSKLYVPAPLRITPPASPPPVRYVELHCKTNFSFLEGASHPDELVAQAARLGYAGMAVTDRNSLAGVVRAHVAAKEAGLKLVVGAEITMVDAGPILLWAMNRQGYGRLCRLLTRGRRQAPKGECRLAFADVAEHADGLLIGVLLPASPSIRRRIWLAGVKCLGIEPTPSPSCIAGLDDCRRLAVWQRESTAARVPLVAAGDVHYHEATPALSPGCADGHSTQDDRRRAGLGPLLQRRTTAADLERDTLASMPNTPRSSRARPRWPTAAHFHSTNCDMNIPRNYVRPARRPSSYLARLTWAGAIERYPAGIPPKVSQLIERELAIIEELNYAAYFLTVWDLVRFARSVGILCQGRGSAANSAVCYCLGVTAVDPDRIDVLFERFISKDRAEAPDIDIDFEHQRREEVIQYIYEKYGRERAGMTAELITYRPRSAVRDVGKALGLSLDRVDALAKVIGHASQGDELLVRLAEAGLDPRCRLGRQLIHLVREILGFPRHLSQHVGGMVLTRLPLCEIVPIENASMPGRTVVEWDKDDLDALGHPQGRLPGTRDALGDPAVPGSDQEAHRRIIDPGHHSRRRSGGLRDDSAGRHGRRFPDRIACPDEHAAAAQAEGVLRPGRRGGDRAPGPDPGEDGPSLPAAP